MNLAQPDRVRYTFGHRAIPAYFFQDPSRFIKVLDEDGAEFLRRIWDEAARKLPQESHPFPTEIQCEVWPFLQGATIGLVVFPPPKAMTDLYFSAIVYRPEDRKFQGVRPAIMRYLTLEHSFNYRDETQLLTVLAEWTPDGAHRNLGPGPEPKRSLFIEVVTQLVFPETNEK